MIRQVIELVVCYALAAWMLRAAVRVRHAAPACWCDDTVTVESVVTGEKVAEWCPACQRRWYYLPYVSGRSA